jgi:TolB-like protein
MAKIAKLKVISRTSVMQYPRGPAFARIAQALGVANILEGSVRRVGNRPR